MCPSDSRIQTLTDTDAVHGILKYIFAIFCEWPYPWSYPEIQVA